jgi:hypothetical protein
MLDNTLSNVPSVEPMVANAMGWNSSTMSSLGFRFQNGAWTKPVAALQGGGTGGRQDASLLNQEQFQQQGGGRGVRWWIGGGGKGGGRVDVRAERAGKPKGRGSGVTGASSINLNVGT